ncbi:MAG: insulinase family protein [Melioribacter sp.]|nr:insulinase family protein [Melioribacter sp.]
MIMLDRSIIPIPTKELLFNIPEIKFLKLVNDIDISFVYKENLPIVYAEIIIFSGSRLDPSDKKGLGYLTSLLIDEGAGEYDALQLSEEFEKLGSAFSVSADHDTIILSILSLTENFERSLELVSKIVLKPRFEEKDFQREKKKVLDQILQLKDEPSFIASSAFERRVFGDSYYGFPEIGFAESIARISNDDVKDFFASTFTSSNAKIVSAGNLNETEIVNLFNKYFSEWISISDNNQYFENPKRKETSYYFIHKSDSAQSEIRVGHLSKKRNTNDFIPTRIMNTILGGQFSSRINSNLREKRGFTYGANSSFHYYKEAGLFEISTAVNIENTGEAIIEILKELNGIREHISDEEINFAKSYLIKQFPSRFETLNQIAKNLESLLIHSLPTEELINYTYKVKSVTNEEVIASAINNVLPDQLVIVAVGDRKKVLNQLKQIQGAEPVELDLYGNLLT